MERTKIADWASLPDRTPTYAMVAGVDLVIVRHGEDVSVLYGRCLHRGALLADGRVEGDNLICGLHNWDYRIDTGVSEYNNEERLKKFRSYIRDGSVYVDAAEIAGWADEHPQPFDRAAYQGLYADTHPEDEEPHVRLIQHYATHGLTKSGHHGEIGAMGVPRQLLPSWDAIQILTAQLHRFPLLDEEPVASDVTIGPRARRPVALTMPILISDMSFGALSAEAKRAMAIGAERAGTGVCSGEGGMMPEEPKLNSRYFYEYATGRFGFSWEKLDRVQAVHIKFGQGTKTGTGGHLPGNKVTAEIAAVRGLMQGESAISPARFADWADLEDVRRFVDEVRERTRGVPIGFKLSAQHIEKDIDAALACGADYVILDGRGGGTGASPLLFRDNISVPTIPALARARRRLDARGATGVTLIITGGLRTAADFVKALALGADVVAISNSAMQAIGCLGMRACHTNNCPVGIATQKDHLRARLEVERSAAQLARFLDASVDLMKVLARACGHRALSGFTLDDLTTFDRDMAALSGIPYAGVLPIAGETH